jgi:hypothetical protein
LDIAKHVKDCRQTCNFNRKKLLQLGKSIINHIEDENVYAILLDTDFRDRSVMKIISDNRLQELFASYKADVVLEEIW